MSYSPEEISTIRAVEQNLEDISIDEKPKLGYRRSYKSLRENIPHKHIVTDTVHSNLPSMQERNKNEKMGEKLLNILENREACIMFRAFLKDQKCEENISFWVDVELFKREHDGQDLKEKANALYNKYFAEEASVPLNIDSEVKEELKRSIDSGISLETYDQVQKQIFRLMETSQLSKFLNSEHYHVYQQGLKEKSRLKNATKSKSSSNIEDRLKEKGRARNILLYRKTGLQFSTDRLELERLFHLKENNRDLLNNTM